MRRPAACLSSYSCKGGKVNGLPSGSRCLTRPKAACDVGADGGAALLDESYACFGTEDFRIGYRAFLEKKKPEFKGR